jgi:hypothetical protein
VRCGRLWHRLCLAVRLSFFAVLKGKFGDGLLGTERFREHSWLL